MHSDPPALWRERGLGEPCESGHIRPLVEPRRVPDSVTGAVTFRERDHGAVLLRRIADLAREVIGASYGAVGVLGPEGELSGFVYSGIDEEAARKIGPLPTGRGVLGAVIEEGRPLRLREIADYPRAYGFPEHHPEMHTFLGVPIVVKGTVFGRLYLTEKEGGADFTKDDERIAQMLAAQAGVAIENARLTEAVRDLAVLEERERISKELHDGVIQAVYSIGLALQAAISLVPRDPDTAVQRIDGAIAELDNVVRDVRNYIFELRPSLVVERGLRDAIHELAEDLRVNTLANVVVELQEEACSSLSGERELHIIQIVREVLSNVARHSEASEVLIRCMRRDEQELVLEVTDDGKGIDSERVRAGHGLRNMEERALELGGELDISPGRVKGMRHRLRVPLHETIELT
jgi:signal transduction histidine kinase